MTQNSFEGDHLLIARFAHLRIFPSIAEFGVVHRLGPKLEMGLFALMVERLLKIGFNEEALKTMLSKAIKHANVTPERADKQKQQAAQQPAPSHTVEPVATETDNVVKITFNKPSE